MRGDVPECLRQNVCLRVLERVCVCVRALWCYGVERGDEMVLRGWDGMVLRGEMGWDGVER